MKITGKSIIGKVLLKHPNTAKIFHKFGLSCIQCPVASSETIERGALAHGIDQITLKKLLHEINKAIENKKK